MGLPFFFSFLVVEILSILDSFMDGQIGSHEENSSLPCLLEGFLGLGSPNLVTDDLETVTKTPFKVLNSLHFWVILRFFWVLTLNF